MKFKVIFDGRLGNQMFQYAFAYKLSRLYNTELYYNKHCIIHNTFDIPVPNDDILWKESIREYDCYKSNYEIKYTRLVDNNYCIFGYWQNENYFKEYSSEIKLIYKIPKYNISPNDLIIHIRRGDYIDNPNFFYCDLDWYKKAINQFRFDNLHIVSDDNDWCKKVFIEYSPIIPELNELHTLGYISSFKNIIISNSSFGWWGAYLSNNANVMYPSIWRPKHLDCKPGLKIWKSLK